MIPPTAKFNKVLQATAAWQVAVKIRLAPPEFVKAWGKLVRESTGPENK
jgi:hypothetical protein